MLHKQVSQTAATILDQIAVQKRKISRPKNMVQRSSCVLMRLLYKEKDPLVPRMDAKQLPHEFYATVGSKEAAAEEPRRNRDELRSVQRNSQTLAWI